MRRRILSLLVILCTLALASAAMADVIDNLLPGEWYQVPNSHIRSVLPSPVPPGDPTMIIKAWNSGAFDTNRNEYLITGGGHQDYGGNEVYAFSISTLTWRVRTPPSPSIPPNSGYACSPRPRAETYADGKPSAKHTYDGMDYLPNVDKFFITGGSQYCDAGDASEYTWTLNLTTNAWTRTVDPPWLDSSLENTSAYNPNDGLMYVVGQSGPIIAYNPVTNTWPREGSLGVVNHQSSVIDPVQNKLLTFGGGVAYEFNLTTLARTTISTTGPQNIVNVYYPGIAYDPIRAKIVGWDGGANIFTYDTVTRVWTQVNPAPTNTIVPTAAATDDFGNHVVLGKWQYIPSKHAFIVVNSIDQDVYIYKSTTTGTNQPPTAPTSPASVADSYQQISVTWTAATDPDGTVASYNVYRCTGSGCTPPVTGPIGNVSASPYVDTTVAPTTTYRYAIAAVDNSGLEGPQSTITANTTTPAAPAFDFTVVATPSTLSVSQGGAQNQETITVTRTAGVAEPVTFSTSALPANATAQFSPTACTPTPTTCTSTMTVTTGSGTTTPTGNTAVTVTGTASPSGTQRTGNFTLTVTALPSFDFTVSTAPSAISAAQNGGSGQSTVTVTLISGTALGVTFTNSALPANAFAVFNPTSCTPSGGTCTSIMTITTGSGTSTPTGNTSVTVTGTSGATVRTSAAFTFTVTAAGGVSLPDNTWVVRTVPLFPAGPAQAYDGNSGSKHVRLNYDNSRGLIYVWGGDYIIVEGAYVRSSSQERMWSYNVATDTWAAVLTEAQASVAGNPKGVCVAATAYDSSRQVWWMTGGEERAVQAASCGGGPDCYPAGLVSCYIWAFRPSNNTWYRAGPAPDCGDKTGSQTNNVVSSEVMAMEYNYVLDELLVPCQNGGSGGFLCTYSLAGITLGDAGNHDNWTARTGIDTPLFEQEQFAIDTARGRAIFYSPFLHQTWMYNLTTRAWTQLNTQNITPKDAFGMVYDVAQDAMVIFGGLDDFQGCGSCSFLNQVWTLPMGSCPGASCNWTLRTMGGPTMPPRHGDAIAYDVTNDAIVVWGGTGGFQTGIDQYGRNGTELWLLRLNLGAADTTPPTVSITAPAPGTVSGAAVTVSATANDNVGVSGVQFKLDGANLQTEDTSSPYSIIWDSYTTTNGSHTLTAVARDTSNNTTTSSGVAVTVSNSAPAAPTGLSVTATSGTQTHGSWTASAGGAASGYKVYRCTESSPPTPCTPTVSIQTLGNVLVFDDTLLTPSTTYCYAVAGTNLVGEGTKSTAFCVATPAAGAPATPTNFVLNPPTPSQVSGSWTASAGATGYKIYRCSGASCTPIPPAILTLGVTTTFTDTTVVGGTPYGYSVSATNGSGESALFTPTAEVTVPTANPPLTPTGFTVATQGPNRVNGSWNVAGDATGYKVLRCTGFGCTPTDPPLQTLGVVTSFVDLTPVATLTYGYALQATNANGPSPSTTTQYVTMPAQTCAGTLTNVTPATIANFLNTHTWVPGDTMALGAGNYPNGLSLYNINGTALCPITVTGPTSGSPAIILGSAGANTLRLQNSSYVIVQYLEINPQNLGGDGVNNQATTHDITLQNLNIHGCKDLCTVALCGYDADNPIDSQGIVGISTNRAIAWNWTIRRNTITDCGTGMYLGNSDGEQQFLNGLIEYNLIYDTLGYNAEIKQMNPLPVPGPSGMPTGTTKTVIRYNTWSKANNSNGGPIANDGLERPCLTLGYAPLTGPAAAQENYFEVYGNFFYQNPFEALFQAAGNVALYDNLFVNTLASGVSAVNFQFHNGGPPRIVRIFQNTIVNNGPSGIIVSGGNTSFTQSAIGNAVFSAAPQVSVATMSSNATGTYASASTPLTNPFAAPGAGLDLFPKAGQLSGTAINSSTYNTYTDYNRDFNAVNRPTNTIRGAYGGQGTNPGWLPLIAIQPTRIISDVLAPAAPTNLRVVQP